jgi:hypothetical protein
VRFRRLASCHWEPATPRAHHDAHHFLAESLMLITNMKRSYGETTSSAREHERDDKRIGGLRREVV